MLILKRPECVLYDTENPDKMLFSPETFLTQVVNPLHLFTDKMDWDFCKEHFLEHEGTEHPIFRDFGNSHFYVFEPNL